MPHNAHELWSLLAKHHGLDWLAMALTFLSMWRLGDHKKDGFLWGVAATAAWTLFNLGVASVAGVVANIVFMALNLRGFLRWRAAPGDPGPPTPRP